jgi:hypothetical protein
MLAPADYPPRRPSALESLPTGRRTARLSRLYRCLRRGHALTDRDRVDAVPGQTSISAATLLPLPKNADAVPSPAAASLPRTACTLPLASGPPPAVTIAAIQFCDLSQPRTCRSNAPRRPVADRTGIAGGARPLVDRAAAGEGTASAFFKSRMVAAVQGFRRGTASTRSRFVEAGRGWKAVHRILGPNTRERKRGKKTAPRPRGRAGAPNPSSLLSAQGDSVPL